MGKKASRYHGILPLRKEVGMTSHDAVQALRRILDQRRIGHTGTLDPLADGLLLVCLGRATKVARFVIGLDKTYEAGIRFGLKSETFDREGIDPEAVPAEVPPMSDSDIDELLLGFVGRIRQQVPLYSAVRVGGEPLYRIARRGGEAPRPEREITIYEIERLNWQAPTLKLRVTCSSGTYIRSLADDLGNRVGCGAYLAGLTRTRIGDIDLTTALTLAQVEAAVDSGEIEGRLLGSEQVLPLAAMKVTDEFSARVIQGKAPTPADIAGFEGRFAAGDHVLLKSSDGRVLAIGTAGVSSDAADLAADNMFTYLRVLN